MHGAYKDRVVAALVAVGPNVLNIVSQSLQVIQQLCLALPSHMVAADGHCASMAGLVAVNGSSIVVLLPTSGFLLPWPRR